VRQGRKKHLRKKEEIGTREKKRKQREITIRLLEGGWAGAVCGKKGKHRRCACGQRRHQARGFEKKEVPDALQSPNVGEGKKRLRAESLVMVQNRIRRKCNKPLEGGQ